MGFINHFSKTGWPFIGVADPHERKLQDSAEDVDFEDVKEEEKTQPEIDKEARAKQIAKAVEERVSDLLKKSPMTAILHMTTFIEGASWADEHPLSSYKNRTDWIAAQHAEVRDLMSKASIANEPLFEAILFLTFADGARWANDNPAPLK